MPHDIAEQLNGISRALTDLRRTQTILYRQNGLMLRLQNVTLDELEKLEGDDLSPEQTKALADAINKRAADIRGLVKP